ncbi:MAG: hypothetical protein D8M58_09315 [Calditrichaeota bacterium]|nr:MAG: hypothetical protein DWQ03_17175 [Calditrichota bacterium]MBL1205585.1 hypothetical protein [Calditrichota bacterium]NOG45414.1 hypothetical protein [Calditrichota bacterium]
MQNKTVLLTGASGNLGQAVKELFLKNGYSVAAAVHPSLWVTPKAITNVIQFACSSKAADLHGPVFKVYGNG